MSCIENRQTHILIDHVNTKDSDNWNANNGGVSQLENGLGLEPTSTGNSFVRDLNADFVVDNNRFGISLKAIASQEPIKILMEIISNEQVLDSKQFDLIEVGNTFSLDFDLIKPQELVNPKIRIAVNGVNTLILVETKVEDYIFCEEELEPGQTVLFDELFNFNDLENWTKREQDNFVFRETYLEFSQEDNGARFKRSLGVLPNGQDQIRLSGKIGVNSSEARSDRIYYQLQDENGKIIYSKFIDLETQGNGLQVEEFNDLFELENRASREIFFVTFNQTGPNPVALEQLTTTSIVTQSASDRVYFVDEVIFNSGLQARSTKVEVIDYNVDGQDFVTQQFYNDFSNTYTNGDVTPIYGAWGYCVADADGQNPINQDDPNTFNFFKPEFGLDFNVINGYSRGQAIGYTSGNNYGTGLLKLGVNKPRVLDVNGQMLKGAWFIDIDFTKNFFFRFRVVVNKNSDFPFEGPEVNLIYTIMWVKRKCEFSFFKQGEQNGFIVNENITNQGFLKGLIDPLSTQNPQFDLTPYCEGNFPPSSDCTRQERSLSYGVGVNLPTQGEDLEAIFRQCKYLHRVYASLTEPGDSYKNDYSGFYHQKQLNNESCDFVLVRVTDNIEWDLDNSTYGTFQDFGTLENQNLKTFVVEWQKVLADLGEGAYRVDKLISIAGVDVVKKSMVFNLKTYSRLNADHTARIDCKMDGFMEKDGINFKNSGFTHSLRFPGFFGNREPKLEEDNIIAFDLTRKQVSMKAKNEYKLQTNLVPDCITEEVLDFFLLATDLWGNDYNLNNHSYNYIKTPIKVETVQAPEYKPHTRKAILNITFGDKKLNQNNRNY